MPSTVAELFAAARLTPGGVVRWGTPVPETAPGNYVVALTDAPESLAGRRPTAPLDEDRLAHLLSVRPELQLDGDRPGVDELAARLKAFWLAEEVVLYIGLAGGSIRTRVRQYYGTPLGARKPHAGGWWLKILSVLDELWVHYAATPRNAEAEVAMLQRFAERVSAPSRERLWDPHNPAPFANLRTGRGDNKSHGIAGATGDLFGGEVRPSVDSRPEAPGPPKMASSQPDIRVQRSRPAAAAGANRTQRVTAKDLEAGRIRFPRAAKRLFPDERARIVVTVREQRFEHVRWDPRLGPGHERSGLLAFGKGKLDGLVGVDDALAITAGADGVVLR